MRPSTPQSHQSEYFLSNEVCDRVPSSFIKCSTYRNSGQLVLVQLVELAEIIETVITSLFSPKFIKTPRKDLVSKRVTSVEILNVELFRWHSALPGELAWNQWLPTTQSISPAVAVIQ